MAHVVVLDSIDKDIFVCGLCKSVFHTLQLFLDHKELKCRNETQRYLVKDDAANVFKKSASGTKLTIPQNPETMFSNAITSGLHVESSVKGVSCRLCKKTFKKIRNLLVHMKNHMEKQYQCSICGRCFVQNSHLQRHVMSHKVWPDGLSRTTAKSSDVELLSYCCSYCDLILSNYSQFRVHLKNHLSVKKFKCIQGDCVRLFPTMESLLEHISTDHDPPLYVCHLCNKTFSSLEQIAVHHQNHEETDKKVHISQVKKYKCSQCDACFKKPEKLSLHMATENHKKSCIHCNKTFASDKRLRLHLQIHRALKLFKCSICGSSFHMKKYLTSHMLKHGERQYTCTICKYKFKRKDLLQRHTKSHQLRKLYKCPFKDTLNCKMEFNRSDKFKAHIKYHTKRMMASSTTSAHKPLQDNVSGTLEICIVPLDVDNITM